LDRKEFIDAAPLLTRVRKMLDQAERDGASDEGLVDLRVLVDGFLDLTHAAELQPRAEPAPTPPADAAGPATDPTPEQPKTLFDAASAGVNPPVVVRQDVPPPPPAVGNVMTVSRKPGILDLIINERGAVESATMRESVNAIYDKMLLSAARSWQYRPAT